MSPNPNDPNAGLPVAAPIFAKQLLKNPFIEQWQSAEKASKIIHSYWSSLNGAPGDATSGVEKVRGGYRIRFANGVVYLATDTSVCAWIYGAINEHYEQQGGPEGWLGLPTTDENPFSEGGRFVFFTNGGIYWWPDTGAIALNDIVVNYVGLICFGETDWDQSSDSDEPYAFLSVMAGQGGATTKTPIYGEPKNMGGDGRDGVDAGDVRQDFLRLYEGKPSGLAIVSNLMEHDFGQPEDYLPAMEKTLDDYFIDGIEYIPVFGPVLSKLAKAFGTELVEAIADLLDLRDDFIASGTVQLTPKETVVLAVRPQYRTERGLQFTHESPLLTGDGATYKLYFELKR